MVALERSQACGNSGQLLVWCLVSSVVGALPSRDLRSARVVDFGESSLCCPDQRIGSMQAVRCGDQSAGLFEVIADLDFG
jgi:hypothetical protein